jgi:hypothetical protein
MATDTLYNSDGDWNAQHPPAEDVGLAHKFEQRSSKGTVESVKGRSYAQAVGVHSKHLLAALNQAAHTKLAKERTTIR